MARINKSLIAKFISGGLVVALTEFALFALFINVQSSLILAHTGSFLIALLLSFAVNRQLVFKSGVSYVQSSRRQFGMFLLLAAINLLVGNVLILVLAQILPELLAKLITMATIAAYNFVIYRFGIFNLRKLKTTTQPSRI